MWLFKSTDECVAYKGTGQRINEKVLLNVTLCSQCIAVYFQISNFLKMTHKWNLIIFLQFSHIVRYIW